MFLRKCEENRDIFLNLFIECLHNFLLPAFLCLFSFVCRILSAKIMIFACFDKGLRHYSFFMCAAVFTVGQPRQATWLFFPDLL